MEYEILKNYKNIFFFWNIKQPIKNNNSNKKMNSEK